MSLYDDDDVKAATTWSSNLKLVPQMKRNPSLQNKKVNLMNIVE